MTDSYSASKNTTTLAERPSTCIIVIPARYASKRYPGKPLVQIQDKSLIHHTILAGLKAKAEIDTHQHLDCLGVFVATDDERIQDHVKTLAAETNIDVDVIMTSPECENGTIRTAEAYQKLAQNNNLSADIIINLQGDSLLTPARFIVALVDHMHKNTSVHISTPALRCDRETLKNFQEDAAAGRVGGTTMTMTRHGDALYFSKQIIPYIDPGHRFTIETEIPVFHHVGLYGYRPQALSEYTHLPEGPCETHEKLEQLRFLENGHSIRCVIVDGRNEIFWEVNNPEDVDRVAPHLNQQNKP